MMTFLMTFGVTLGILLLCMAGMNLRFIFQGKEFRGSCGHNNPMLKAKIGDCQLCGKKADEACKMPEVH
jgi:hypothetical protein